MAKKDNFWDKLAIQSYRSLLKKDPKNPLLHNNLGIAFLRTGRVLEAIRSLKKAIKNDAQYLEAYYHLGSAYQRAGKLTKAIHTFNEYNKIEAKNKKNSSIVEGLIKELETVQAVQ